MTVDDSYFDLNGMKIRSLDLDWDPFVRIQNCDDNERCEVHGFSIDLVDLVARRLNFTYESTREPTGLWGHMDDFASPFNENWSGVMGGVITGK